MTIVTGIITTFACRLVLVNNDFLRLIIRGCVCVIISNVIYICILFKSKEFKYILQIIKNILANINRNKTNEVEINR